MSMIYCEECGKQIDSDFNAEHFYKHDIKNLRKLDCNFENKLSRILSDMVFKVSEHTEFWIKKNGILGELDSGDFTTKPQQQIIDQVLALLNKKEV